MLKNWLLPIPKNLKTCPPLPGLVAILYYSTTIFTNAGLPHKLATYSTIGVGVLKVLSTASSSILMDKFGRRSLQLIGLMGIIICDTLITVTSLFQTNVSHYLVTIFTFGFIICFSIGPGPITWLITPELFEQYSSSMALAISAMVNHSFNLLVSLTFPSIEAVLKEYTFLVYAVLTLIFFIFQVYYLPETKGKTSKQIAQLLAADGIWKHGVIGQTNRVGANQEISISTIQMSSTL